MSLHSICVLHALQTLGWESPHACTSSGGTSCNMRLRSGTLWVNKESQLLGLILGNWLGITSSLALYLDISNSSVEHRPTEEFALCWADGSHLYMPYGIKAQVWFLTLSVACFRHKSVTSNVTVSVCIAICSDKGKANKVRKLRNISVLYARLGRVSSSCCLAI